MTLCVLIWVGVVPNVALSCKIVMLGEPKTHLMHLAFSTHPLVLFYVSLSFSLSLSISIFLCLSLSLSFSPSLYPYLSLSLSLSLSSVLIGFLSHCKWASEDNWSLFMSLCFVVSLHLPLYISTYIFTHPCIYVFILIYLSLYVGVSLYNISTALSRFLCGICWRYLYRCIYTYPWSLSL